MPVPVISTLTYDRNNDRLKLSVTGDHFGQFGDLCDIAINGRYSGKVTHWDNLSIEAEFHPLIFGGTLRVYSHSGEIGSMSLKAAIPNGYVDAAEPGTPGDAINDFWKYLGDFWHNFEDRGIIEAVWTAMGQMHERVRLSQEQTKRATSIQSMPYLWKETWHKFTIDAQEVDIDPRIKSIPTMFKHIHKYDFTDESFQLIQDSDFLIKEGKLVFTDGFSYPFELWAPIVYVDKRTIQRHYGALMNTAGNDSQEYYQKVLGLWYTAWHGPTMAALKTSINLIVGQPIAETDDEVVSVSSDIGIYEVELKRGGIYQSPYPTSLVAGQKITRLTPLFNISSISDYADPRFKSQVYAKRRFDSKTKMDLGTRLDSKSFFTSYWDDAPNKATFKVTVEYDAMETPLQDMAYIRLLLNRYKPVHANCILDVSVSFFDYLDEDDPTLPSDQFDTLAAETLFEDTLRLDINVDGANVSGLTYDFVMPGGY